MARWSKGSGSLVYLGATCNLATLQQRRGARGGLRRQSSVSEQAYVRTYVSSVVEIRPLNIQSCRVPLPARRCLDRAYVSVSALRFAPAPTPTLPTPMPCIACVRTYVRIRKRSQSSCGRSVAARDVASLAVLRTRTPAAPARDGAYVRAYVRPRIFRCPKVINQVGGRIRTYVRIHARMYVPSRVRVASTEKKLRMLCQYVVPLLQVVPVVPCVPVVPGGVRTLRTCTYARISVCTQVRTYVRSSQRRVMCARCARSRQYVRYVRAHVRSSHSRVMFASCARSRKCVRTYVRTYVILKSAQ